MTTVDAPVAYQPFQRDTWRNPYDLYRRLRDEDPVHQAPQGFWVLSRFDDVYDAARDTSLFSSAHGLTFSDETAHLALLPTIVMMDPPEHTDYRRLVSADFTSRRVRDFGDDIRAFAAEQVASLVATGSGDFVAEVARRVPNFVVAEYLGVPLDDRQRFDAWTTEIIQASATEDFGGDAAQALGDMYAYFTELVEDRRAHPGTDMLSAAIAARPDIDTAHLVGYGFVMVTGGNDTATGLLAGISEYLTAYADQRARLIADPSLIPSAVEEALRLTSPVQGLCREVLRDTVVRDQPIAVGERVLLCYGAANRDDREFGNDAESFDVGRTIRRILTFSSGPHYCLGAHSARMQGRILIEELLRQCPDFSVDASQGRFADGPFTRRYETLPFTAH
jgi:cytochrome P450